nr:methyl-accepting chemotaxis protein [Pseudenhygromyxa sp. WMMC2535]
MDPIRRLSASARRLSEVGDLSAMGRLPQVTNDEVGTLTTNVNRVLDDLESLTAGAQAVARGDLSVAIVGAGELPDAFRSMVEQLHEVVLQIRETSIGLATAASEIHAATSEQERAADRQSAGMRSLGQVMDSLASSASQVSGAATGVLENAEGTLTTTDEMSRKIDELNERSKGIGELLELIREIADRSDLLALNGSLEATRAGEAGRGFSLVAAEMRRLAERVTGTVTDVRELVADIKAASGSTVMVTERSRKLAEGTAEAAREIAAETQRQSQDTERATRSVREVGEVIVQIGEAITETRSAAEGLRVQAATLEELIGRFEVRGESHSGSSMRFLGSGVYESGVYGSGVYGSGVYESAAKREGGRS